MNMVSSAMNTRPSIIESKEDDKIIKTILSNDINLTSVIIFPILGVMNMFLSFVESGRSFCPYSV